MKPDFECLVTAGFLHSGRILAQTSHCAAAIAAIGVLLARPTSGRYLLAAAVAVWPFACYFAVRVAVDADLLQAMANDPEESGRKLDRILRAAKERTLSQRTAGAMKLWYQLIGVVSFQLIALCSGLTIQILTS